MKQPLNKSDINSLFVFVFAASTLDALFTILWLNLDVAKELNPILNAAYLYTGSIGLYLVKTFQNTVFTFICIYLYNKATLPVKHNYIFLNIMIYIPVVVYINILIYHLYGVYLFISSS